MRRELVSCITRLECALDILGLRLTWFEALQQYRAQRRLETPLKPAMLAAAYGVSGLLPSGVCAYARDLDLAFNRIHSYDPPENLTQGVVGLVHARKRSKGDTAVEVERLLVKERFANRTEAEQARLIKQAIQMVGQSKRSTVYNVRARILERQSAGPGLAGAQDKEG